MNRTFTIFILGLLLLVTACSGSSQEPTQVPAEVQATESQSEPASTEAVFSSTEPATPDENSYSLPSEQTSTLSV